MNHFFAIKRNALFFSFFLLSFSLFSQQVRYVKPSPQSTLWAHQSPTLVFSDVQAAIDASNSGDQIWIAAGTYYPTSGIDGNVGRFLSFLMKDGVSLYGGFAGTETTMSQRVKASDASWDYAHQTILSGNYNKNNDSTDNSYHVVWFGTTDHTDTTRIEGVTIQHGYADGVADFDQKGGGAFLTKKSVIENSIIRYNVALYGGGLFCRSNARIVGCFIQHNKTWRQNGFGGGVSCNSATQIIEKSIFDNNWAAKDGGAIQSGINTEIVQCQFVHNVAQQNGGAIWAMTGQKTTQCTFWENQAQNGGAMYVNYNNNIISSSSFVGNFAENGGALYFAAGKVGQKLQNSLIAHNEAEIAGGVWSGSDLLVVHTTVVRNKGFVAGGISGSANDKIYNSIIWGNGAGSYPQLSGEVNCYYSAIEGLTNIQENNIALPEQTNDSVYFFNPIALLGNPLTPQNYLDLQQANYEILGLSVCKDAGTSVIPNYQFTNEDLNGNPRINHLPDMGAYELTCNPMASMQIISPDPPFYAQQNMVFKIDEYDAQYQYVIDFGDATPPVITSLIMNDYSYDSAGVYVATLFVNDTLYQCVDRYELIVEIQTDASAIRQISHSSISLFPNPADQQITITVSYPQKIYLTIIDAIGKKKIANHFFGQEVTINIKDWDSGVYVVFINDEKNNIIKSLKFIKL